LDTGATGGSYVDEDFAKRICEENGIGYVELPRPRPVKGYNGDQGRDITHAIFPKVDIQGHVDNVLLYITRLHQPIILGKSWMAKHGVVLDMTTDLVYFKEGQCTHSNEPFRAMVAEVIEKQTDLSQIKAFQPKTIAKRSDTLLAELVEPIKPTNQRTDLPGPSQKVTSGSGDESESGTETETDIEGDALSSDARNKKKRTRRKKKVRKTADKSLELASVISSINMIGAAPFAFLARQKGAQVFSVSMNDILAERTRQAGVRAEESIEEGNLQNLIPKEFCHLAKAFSKKAADTLPEHGSSDHHITLDNNAESATTKASPFFANLGYHPRLSFDLRPETDPPKSQKERLDRKMALDKAKELKVLWEKLQDEIGLAQSRMERFADQHRRPAPAYKVGDMVWLSAKNLRTQRPSVKLDHKNEGPYKVLEKVGATSYRLQIPEETKIHPVFHSNLLRLDREDPLPGQNQPPPGPVIIDEGEEDEEYEVERILDSRLYKRNQLQYRVDWVGWPPDKKWYPARNFEHSPEVIKQFHAAYPKKPGP
jgi:hypothetical protein